MDPQKRIRTILLIDKIKADPVYAKIITLMDSSHYRNNGQKIKSDNSDSV